jgi:uncharacterized protein YhaN
MRIAALELVAFGPFTGARLRFDERRGLHVVYGPNEAGKSTALRAVTALFFGVPTRTVDAHLHALRELRVGATLERVSGERLTVVRTRRQREPLVDEAGRPVDEARLGAFLGGATEELFRTLFALDHESLRAGGQALLEGRGELGASLFGAGAGGAGAGRLLRALAAEADALYSPAGNARVKPLNAAIRAFAEAKRRRDAAALEPRHHAALVEEAARAAW